MKIKTRYYKEQLSHAGSKYIISTLPDIWAGKTLATVDTLQEILDFGEKNNCVLQKA